MNIPNIDFPELNLKLSYLRNNKKPNKKFERHNIKLVRIRSVRQGFSFIVYPEFKYSNEWYKFWKDDQPIIAKIIIHSINGISSGSNRLRLKKVKKTIEKWLKEFSKDGNKFKIVNNQINKVYKKQRENDENDVKETPNKEILNKEITISDEDINEEKQDDHNEEKPQDDKYIV